MTKIYCVVTVALLSVGLVLPADAQQFLTGGERVKREVEQAQQLLRMFEEPRPIEAVNTVWIEDMTWVEVRDAIADGKTTVVVSTGGIEQNGPYLVTNKHQLTLRSHCEGIARDLGNALCAPILSFVPEGNIDPPTGMLRFPGTIGLREETYRMVLDDIASSLRQNGFTHIVFIADSGGNTAGMAAIAEILNQRWRGVGATVYYIPEYYNFPQVAAYLRDELGVVQPVDDGHHDNLYQTAYAMLIDPAHVRYEQRVEAGQATINGVSIADKEWVTEIAQKLVDFRVGVTVEAIRARFEAAVEERE